MSAVDASDRDDVAIAVPPPQPTAAEGGVNADPNAPAVALPRRGTRLVWWKRKFARTVFRTVFSVLNVVVFFVSLLVLVEFVREIEQEQESAGSGDTPIPPGGSTPVPSTTTNATQDLSWKERYVLLGEDVFGSDYKAVVDVYFGFVIVATFSGAFGSLLRQATPIFVAVVCYVPAWLFTLVATIGIHRHLAEHPIASAHDESKARYSVALAWTWLCLVVLIVLFVVGVLLGRSMRTHKADRYRITHRGRIRRGSDDDEDDDEEVAGSNDYEETMVSNVPNFTTDGSGPPRKRQLAKVQQHQQQREAAMRKSGMSTPPPQSPLTETSAASSEADPVHPAQTATALTGAKCRKTAAPLTADDVRRILLQATVDELPQALVEKQACHHVYDGDTLTLQNRERVRLVGVDTPEISRFEPFAEDARAFTKRWCQQRTLFLQQPVALEAQFEGRTNASSGNDKFMVDKYGRRRAIVYVAIRKDHLLEPSSKGAAPAPSETAPAPGASTTAYLNVNEALLLLGFATFYHPSPENEAVFQARFLALQREARNAQRGIWGGFRDREVCYDKRADVFHFFIPKGAASNAAIAAKVCDDGRSISGKAGQDSRYVKQLASKAMDAGYAPCRECQGSISRADMRR
uniref:TNase-like domain-containing protein n=1 Tax=Neobodo designis TaxID=312471 RepID=A0A7S1L0F1_NEODS|mmetsp:Transcript_11981/g.37301  ORF Transcript_11981/g.37301 Transcript_11981/m.37301 type:complete len:633 (+) Transcript_11981:34-1932(+)